MQRGLAIINERRGRWRYGGVVLLIVLAFVVSLTDAPLAAADRRMQNRSLYMSNTRIGDKASYTVSMQFMSPQAVGSVDLLFCVDPIPHNPCVAPAGLDASAAILTSQSGESGFSILSKTANHIVLTRLPSMIQATPSSYVFDNITNPTDTAQSFSIRMRSHAATDASGPQIDFGSVKGQVTRDIVIETQVPPMLIFCLAQQVEYNCTGTNGVNYSDMGQLNATLTLLAQSQMAVGTNASGGFTITANGGPLSAGTNVIASPAVPTVSQQGTNQFGLNLVANDTPVIGSDPEGQWANALASPDYSRPNHYKYVSGDVVAYSPNVSLMKKFTVSYILNSSPDLRAGVYTTTITYIASGRF